MEKEQAQEIIRLLHELLSMQYHIAWSVEEMAYLQAHPSYSPGRFGPEWNNQQHDWLVQSEEHQAAAQKGASDGE